MPNNRKPRPLGLGFSIILQNILQFSKIFTIFAEKYEVMETIINFLNTYSNIIVLSIIALLLICAFICCITQVAAKIAVFLGACGCIGIALTLGFIAFLLIIEFKEVCSK